MQQVHTRSNLDSIGFSQCWKLYIMIFIIGLFIYISKYGTVFIHQITTHTIKYNLEKLIFYHAIYTIFFFIFSHFIDQFIVLGHGLTSCFLLILVIFNRIVDIVLDTSAMPVMLINKYCKLNDNMIKSEKHATYITTKK